VVCVRATCKVEEVIITVIFVGSSIVFDTLVLKLIEVVKRLLCAKAIVSVALVLGLYVDDTIVPGHTCGVVKAVGELRVRVILVVLLALRETLSLFALNRIVSVRSSSGRIAPSVVALAESFIVDA